MIGSIAGDIIGSVYEYEPIRSKRFELFSDRCLFTDDSVLTIALADSILTGTPYEENLRKFYQLYPDAGYGNSFDHWARNRRSGPYNSWGNGAAMRISPAGFAFDDLETVLARAGEYTAVTHDHPDGIKGGKAAAAAVFLARTGSTRDQVKAYVESEFGYDLGMHIDEIRPGYGFDESCQRTVTQAIRAFTTRPVSRTRSGTRSRWAATPTRWRASPEASHRRSTEGFRPRSRRESTIPSTKGWEISLIASWSDSAVDSQGRCPLARMVEGEYSESGMASRGRGHAEADAQCDAQGEVGAWGRSGERRQASEGSLKR